MWRTVDGRWYGIQGILWSGGTVVRVTVDGRGAVVTGFGRWQGYGSTVIREKSNIDPFQEFEAAATLALDEYDAVRDAIQSFGEGVSEGGSTV